MLRIYLIWGGVIFTALKILPYITAYFLGFGPAVFINLIGVGITFYAAYKGSLEMLEFAPNKRKVNSAVNGFLLLLVAQALGSVLDYAILGRFDFGSGLFPLIAAVLGGYWVDRKTKGTKIFGL